MSTKNLIPKLNKVPSWNWNWENVLICRWMLMLIFKTYDGILVKSIFYNAINWIRFNELLTVAFISVPILIFIVKIHFNKQIQPNLLWFLEQKRILTWKLLQNLQIFLELLKQSIQCRAIILNKTKVQQTRTLFLGKKYIEFNIFVSLHCYFLRKRQILDFSRRKQLLSI